MASRDVPKGTSSDPSRVDRATERLQTRNTRGNPDLDAASDEPADGPVAERHGRRAERPRHIPLRGWFDATMRVKQQVGADHVSLIAAGVAFYALLALIPALGAMLSIWGMFLDPQTVTTQVDEAAKILPQSAQGFVGEQLSRIAAQPAASLGLSAIIGILVSLWSANKGTKAIIEAINIAYDETKRRGFFRGNLLSLAITFAATIGLIVAFALVVALPIVLGRVGLGAAAETTVGLLRWPLLIVLMIFALRVLYRIAPNRHDPEWAWVTPGSVLATTLWIGASILFSYYVSNFGSYNETYGSIGGVVILLLWFFLTSFVVLLGAELNSELERQTREDTTTGPGRAMGQREAYAADTLGKLR